MVESEQLLVLTRSLLQKTWLALQLSRLSLEEAEQTIQQSRDLTAAAIRTLGSRN